MSREKLRPKEEIFVLEYFKDFRAGRAYIAAGYKAKNENVAAASGAKLLSRPIIANRINELVKTKTAKHEIDIDTIVRELAAITTVKITDFAEVIEEERDFEIEPEDVGTKAKLFLESDEDEINRERELANQTPTGPSGLPGLTKKVKFVTMRIKPSSEWPKDKIGAVSSLKQTRDGIEIKFWEKTKATDQLGRHFAMFTDNIKHSGEVKTINEDNLDNLTNDELMAYYALRKKAAGK